MEKQHIKGKPGDFCAAHLCAAHLYWTCEHISVRKEEKAALRKHTDKRSPSHSTHKIHFRSRNVMPSEKVALSLSFCCSFLISLSLILPTVSHFCSYSSSVSYIFFLTCIHSFPMVSCFPPIDSSILSIIVFSTIPHSLFFLPSFFPLFNPSIHPSVHNPSFLHSVTSWSL